ncbi:PREDICTED: glutamate receptor ionotropic, delta-1-like [Priapulus caudatus]|uniref:Glutamate receptor ionotropic, delta-1-like n=1 Tax=Priapulus caudatus TaxID=37621 RepID=A0ABM1EFN8_PRICU|nr:PREDICTED: glutamate receptor ionotropic, delta-1-like [Priapulus caudatus]
MNFKTLAKYMNFTYSTKTFCSRGFDHIATAISDGSIDLGGIMTVTSHRRERVLFPKAVYTDTYVIVIKTPETSTTATFNVFSPFDLSTWLGISGYGLITATLLRYMNTKAHKNESRRTWYKKLGLFYNYIFGTFVNQGGTYSSPSTAIRVFISCWWTFVIVMVGTYSGTLVSHLSVQTTIEYPFTSLEDAANSHLTPTVVRGFSNENLLQYADPDSNYGKMWRKVLADPQSVVSDIQESIDLTLTGKYFTPMHAVSAPAFIEADIQVTTKCRLTIAPFQFHTTDHSWAMSNTSKYFRAINTGIQILIETGHLQKWMSHQSTAFDKCVKAEVNLESASLSLQQLSSIFKLLIYGCAIATAVLIGEKFSTILREKITRHRLNVDLC